MMPEPQDLWGMLGAAVVGLVSGGVWMRTKLPRDAADIAASRAEVGMIDRLQQENIDLRDTLGKVYDDRNQLAMQLAEVSGSMRAMTEKTAHLEATVEEMRQEISRLTSIIAKLTNT